MGGGRTSFSFIFDCGTCVWRIMWKGQGGVRYILAKHELNDH